MRLPDLLPRDTPGDVEVALSAPQMRALAAICELTDRFGRVSLRALARRLGRSVTGTRYLVERLCQKGFVAYEPHRHNTLRPLYRIGVFG